MEKKFGFLSSSTDPQKLGTTVKGVIIGLATVIIAVTGMFGIEVSQPEVTEVATEAGAIITAYFVLVGLIQKMVVKMEEILK